MTEAFSKRAAHLSKQHAYVKRLMKAAAALTLQSIVLVISAGSSPDAKTAQAVVPTHNTRTLAVL